MNSTGTYRLIAGSTLKKHRALNPHPDRLGRHQILSRSYFKSQSKKNVPDPEIKITKPDPDPGV
jgi:hypothetical protein